MPRPLRSISILCLLLVAALGSAAQTDPRLPAVKTEPIADLRAILPDGGEDARPLVVNFWATWCGPCREEFPDLVEIDREYRPRGLDFVLVSVDDRAVVETRVPEFLAQYEASMPSYLLDLAGRRAKASAIRRVAPRFADAYPLTLLFDRRGRLVYQKAGVVDPKILRAQIEKVLN